MADQLLPGILTDAALRPSSREAITTAYPTLDVLLSATLDEIAAAAGEADATRLWEVLERRWRSEVTGEDSSRAPSAGGLARIVEAEPLGERPTSLRLQLRALALVEVTMRAAGFDPDSRTAD
ncbi:MAG TPA: hypothetical protein VFD90_10110 [Gaiellales bacterium]|jgi:hypothetical protein|nr:hypothetical protein [Gaiellales bacterium]